MLIPQRLSYTSTPAASPLLTLLGQTVDVPGPHVESARTDDLDVEDMDISDGMSNCSQAHSCAQVGHIETRVRYQVSRLSRCIDTRLTDHHRTLWMRIILLQV